MGIVLSVCIVFSEINLIVSCFSFLLRANSGKESQDSVPKPGFHHPFLSLIREEKWKGRYRTGTMKLVGKDESPSDESKPGPLIAP